MQWFGRSLFVLATVGVYSLWPVLKEFRALNSESILTYRLIGHGLLFLVCLGYCLLYLAIIIASTMGQALIDLIFNIHGGGPARPVEPKPTNESSEINRPK